MWKKQKISQIYLGKALLCWEELQTSLGAYNCGCMQMYYISTFLFQDEDLCIDIAAAKVKLSDPESAVLKIQKGINMIADNLDSQMTVKEAKELKWKSHRTPQKPSDMELEGFTETAKRSRLFPIATTGTVKIQVRV